MVNGKFSNNPVIVMGVHRSGTTLLSLLLREMDCHLGADLCRQTLESVSLMRLNNNLLSDCKASWHVPGQMWKVLHDEQCVERLAAQLRSRLFDNSAIEYWGDDESSRSSSQFWGWKDPRNTLTLPIWYRVFPEAKIIHIVRNGIDVAQSLVVRDQKAPRRWIRNAIKTALMNLYPRLRLRFRPCPFTLEEAFQLWAEYLQIAHYNTERIPEKKILHLRYEDLLSEPLSSLRCVADFVGAGTVDSALSKIAAGIDGRRRFAFSTDAKLCAFYRDHCDHPQMVKHSYDRLLDPGCHGLIPKSPTSR